MTSKKIFFLWLTFLLATLHSFCQDSPLVSTVDSVISNDSIFDKLDKSKITTGILFDKAFSLSNTEKFDGVYDTINNLKNWENIYNGIGNAFVNTPTIPELDTILNLAFGVQHERTNQVIPIGILNFNYNFIKAVALDSGYLIFQNNQLYDNSGSTILPYDTAKIFTIAPLQPYIIGSNATFLIDSTYYFTNVSDSLNGMEIDFGDGAGYTEVHWGDRISINYSNSGLVQIKVRLTYQNQILKAGSIFQIADISSNSPDIFTNSIDNFYVFGSVPSQYDFGEGSTQTAFATVYYGCGNSGPTLIKPFIFVEGFDSGHDLASQTHYGDFDWFQFAAGGALDYDGNGSPDLPQLSFAPLLIDKLHSDGYDIVFLDQKNGVDYIQRNAMTVVGLINWVNQNKTGNDEIVVAGASMGGLVTRFALRYMENNNMNHNTKLWITFDSPHFGANIPLGDQYFLKFYADPPAKKDDAKWGIEVLSTAAAQQMLVYNFLSFPSTNSLRSSLISDNNFNFPNNLKKMAIANGSILGVNGNQGFGWGAKMVDMNVKPAKTERAIGRVWAIPDYHNSSSTQTIFQGKITLLGAPIKTEKDLVGGTLPYDNAPGGIENTNESFASSGANVFYQNHCFIPAVSSLGIDPSFISNSDGFYNLFYDIQGNIMLNSNNNFLPDNNIAIITNHNITPFDVIMGPIVSSGFTNINGNQQHVEVSHENIDWLMKEISPNDLFLQHQTVSNGDLFEARNTITMGKNVTNTVPVGDFIVDNGASAIFRAGQEIVVSDGTLLKSGSNCHLYIDPFPCSAPMRLSNNNTNNINNTSTNSADINEEKGKTLPPIILFQSKLNQNIPNPVRNTTDITYSVQKGTTVSIILFDMYGKQITTFVNNLTQTSGVYQITFDASNLEAGIYFYTLYTGKYSETKKMIVIR